ncbi:MAG: hypothetical protein PHR35_13430 [Kiritimatiellae bacterium]|nr:hypothetical protein [Kiritimatiellia bacterium]
MRLALEQVPAYRAWRALDPGPDMDVDTRMAALPLLTKRELRQFGPSGFIAPGLDLTRGLAEGAVELVNTSGTSTEQVTLTWNQSWWDAGERLSWSLNRHARGAGLGDHAEAVLANPLAVGVPAHDGAPLPLEQRRHGRFLYLNEHLDNTRWSDAHARRMAAELSAFQPLTIEANPTLLARFAEMALRLGLRCHQPRLIVFSFELPSRLHWRKVREFFDCPVMNSYGCTEAGCVMTQCEAGSYHQNAEFTRIEFQPLAPRFERPALGRLALTSFGNPWRALLRFDVGDLVRLRAPEEPCPCGRRLGVVAESLAGRCGDLTFDRHGRLLTVDDVDRAMSDADDLSEYQAVQTAPGEWRLLVVGATPRSVAAARERLRALTDARVEAVSCTAVPAEASGKHRLAYSTCRQPDDTFFEGAARAP